LARSTNSSAPETVVLGVGARAQLGLSALQIATALRARQLEPRPAPFPDARGAPAGLAYAGFLPPDLVGLARHVRLAAPAVREAVAEARAGTRAAKVARAVPAIVAVSERDRPDEQQMGDDAARLGAIGRESGVAIDIGASALVRGGHAGFAIALDRARELLDEGAPEVLVGGVESPYHPAVPAWLDARGRLCREDDDAGRIPGEAAAFALLARRRPGKHAAGLARVRAVELESPAAGDDGLLLGKLLRRVARTVRGGAPLWLLPDVNGERARTEAFVRARAEASDLYEQAAVDDLVQHTSDVGAATGALFTAAAILLSRIGAVDAPNVVLALSADDPAGPRAAIALDLPGSGGPFHASRTEVAPHRASPVRGSREPDERERAQMERIARSCLEDIGSMGLLLAPGPADDGSRPEVFGQRLLDNFDALAALASGRAGSVHLPDLDAVIARYAAEADPPDRARRFAAAFCAAHLAAPGRSG
jgi:3-oxoacyl-[acyl-carrier-protein] synthase-1